AKGAYVLLDAGNPLQLILLASGSEVQLAVSAREQLEKEGVGVRVVSMPCWETFSAQDADYRESVIPKAMKARISIEAGTTFGWERWIGDEGIAIGIDRYGESAPGGTVLDKLGINVAHVLEAARRSLRG